MIYTKGQARVARRRDELAERAADPKEARSLKSYVLLVVILSLIAVMFAKLW